jgi:hypothetical protein
MKRTFIFAAIAVLFSTKTAKADVLDTWVVRNSDPSYSLTGIGYGHGMYVATGNPGILLTSPDGITWTRKDLGTANWLADVAFGNNIFVVVGASGTIFSSPDGISWTPRVSGITNSASFNRLRFLNGKFIAVGDGDIIDTSSDGINWTLQNSGLPPVTGNPGDPDNYLSHLYCVNYGNGLYIISGKSSTILLSYDAVNWSPENINSGCCLGDVIYGNGIFVLSAAFSGPGGIMTSPDGFTWVN